MWPACLRQHLIARRFCARVAFSAVMAFVSGCEPSLDVGTWSCPAGARTSDSGVDGGTPFPWSTGFEHRFCDYTWDFGFCYSDPKASFAIVSSPVHTGRYAAAFTVMSDNPDALQARCVRQGALPITAYYGAWYFIKGPRANDGNWNLFHFQGGEPGALHGLWDVSLASASDGALRLYLFDFLRGMVVQIEQAPSIPLGAWFHVEIYLKRASDPSGEVALYQDGQSLLHLTNLITDDTGWGQWYVGNYGLGLTPPSSTVYVDDVSITEAL